jgi:hypothetical protein
MDMAALVEVLEFDNLTIRAHNKRALSMPCLSIQWSARNWTNVRRRVYFHLKAPAGGTCS